MFENEEPSYMMFAKANVRDNHNSSPTIVRELLDRIERLEVKANRISVDDIAEILKSKVKDKDVVDVSNGVEKLFDVDNQTFRRALDFLVWQGYQLYMRPFTQVGTDKVTSVKVLASPKLGYKDMYDRTRHFVDGKKE